MGIQGCQGKGHNTLKIKICPNCGEEIETFTLEAEAVCEECGYTVYNSELNCVRWCDCAEECLGKEQYERIKVVLDRELARLEAEFDEPEYCPRY